MQIMTLLIAAVDKKLHSWFTMRPPISFTFDHRISRLSISQRILKVVAGIPSTAQEELIEAMLVRRAQASDRLSEANYGLESVDIVTGVARRRFEERHFHYAESELGGQLNLQWNYEIDFLANLLSLDIVKQFHERALYKFNEKDASLQRHVLVNPGRNGIVYGGWQPSLYESITEVLIGGDVRGCSCPEESDADIGVTLKGILTVGSSSQLNSQPTFWEHLNRICTDLAGSEKKEDLLKSFSSSTRGPCTYHSHMSVGYPEENGTNFYDTVPSKELQVFGASCNVTFPSSIYSQISFDVETKANLGAVYTPSFLATWVAQELCSLLPTEVPARILDPASGDGALLKAVAAVTNGAVELIGVDVNQEALSLARRGLPESAQLYKADSLAPKAGLRIVEAWRLLLGVRPITGIIANPPWGADVAYSTTELKAMGYGLANGQFDIYDLFVEACLSIAPDNAVLAFILPDSIFYPEHEQLRRLLLTSTQIISISRLGEGFFAGVFRGTVVLIVRKGPPGDEHAIDCMRLTKEWRQRILSGQATLSQAKLELVHPVKQSRFAFDPQARFDIDVREQEEKVLVKMSGTTMPWVRWLVSGRGIELSKHGKVLLYPHCEVAYPLPRNDDFQYLCRACNRSFTINKAEQQQIVRSLQQAEAGWEPIIVGEDVDRYSCFPSRQVRLDVSGINYKTRETFAHRKLLIRKTGLGIKAAIDETGAYTNQVVFHYYVPPMIAAPPFLLDYLQGVLCSRVLLAYHLKRIGENEWRSHPYVTQQIVAELPIPDISEGTWQWRQALAIVDAVERRRKVNSSSSEEDIEIDRLVAGLYGLTPDDCHWVLDVLDQADALEPIRTLRLTERSTLTPIRVA
jgi:hypothetical protein